MKISDLFESKVSNQIKILESICENNGVANIDKISKEVDLDSKTVKLLWSHISEYINDEHDLTTMNDFLAIRIEIFKESWVFDLCEQLLLGKEISIISFSMKHYLSEAGIRKKVIDLNKILSLIELKIISRKGFLFIRGSEIQIRHLAYQFFWTIFRGIQWPFLDIEYEKVNSSLKKILFNMTSIPIKDTTYVEWSFITAINLIRVNHGFQIEEEELPKFIFDILPELPDTQIEAVRKRLLELFSLSDPEQIYFLLQIQRRETFYVDTVNYKYMIEAHQKADTDIYKVYQYLMPYFKQNITYPEGEKLSEAMILSTCVTATMVEGFFRPIAGYEMEDFFNEYAPTLLLTMEEKIKEMETEYPNIEFLKQTKYLSIKFAEAYSLSCDMMRFEKEIFVGVFTDLSSTFEKLLVRKLRSHFELIDNVKFLTIEQSNVEQYDLVIKTSVTINDMRKKGERLLVINPLLEKTDIANIADVLKDIRKKK